ncbi:hypothetical protein R3W88_032947 [Solanum pinnatisectum]|uniref:DUF641 domain-containing protein n=1 Tax=Solanum pinnatisectum TaxID=50273 RepID=A0AAV9LU67_9SOLN|nr:hypothetical protein R3W88_032947 [Solanum pinnatisectum]
MDRHVVTPKASKLARAFANVLHIQGRNRRPKSLKNEDKKVKNYIQNEEALLVILFANISAIKVAYALLQYAQSPHDPYFILSADKMIVSELKTLSELKQCYLKDQFDDRSPEITRVIAEIKEQKNILTTYEIMGNKLDSQLKLKDSENIFLREKLDEANKENKLLEKKLSLIDNFHLSKLKMEYVGWDLDAASSSIQPDAIFSKPNDKYYAFESFVCQEMFDDFNDPYFSVHNEEQSKRLDISFNRFLELTSVIPADYLARKPKSTFAIFCGAKYLKLINHKLKKKSLFGNLYHRNLLNSNEYPKTHLFYTFCEMAKHIWLLHCLAFSLSPEASVFQVKKGCRYSDIYMESVNGEEAFLMSNGSSETELRVGFTVIPGFRVVKSVVQCQVYLC